MRIKLVLIRTIVRMKTRMRRVPARVKVKSEYLIVAKLSPTAPAGERLIVPAKSMLVSSHNDRCMVGKGILPDKFMWSECLEAESAGWGGSGAHRVDVLAPNHMLVPVLLKRSAQK